MHENRTCLRESAQLQQAVQFFVENSQVLSCLHLGCGSREMTWHALGGVRNHRGESLDAEDIFDLASLTKLFTGVMVLRLREEGLLDLDRPVTSYAPMFTNLRDVSVRDIFAFQCALQTGVRVDACSDREQALEALMGIQAGPRGKRAYSDMHCMVLKYVLEGAGKDSYMHLVKTRILDPLGMQHTFCRVPQDMLPGVVDVSHGYRIEMGVWKRDEGPAPGVPHDPKARILWDGSSCPGHAGLFSTFDDMERFARGLLEGRVISMEALREMTVNRTGAPLPGGGYSQYLGYQCYVRHPEQIHSEVPSFMSDHSFALSGFTGHHLSLDLDRGIFVLALGNRVMDRLSVLTLREGESYADFGLTPEGRGTVIWPDGTRVISSVRYVYLRDRYMHEPARQVLEAAGCL